MKKTSALRNEIKSAKGANSVYAYTLTSNEWSTKDFAAVTISPSETTSDLTFGVRGDEQLITQGNTVVFYNPDTKKQLVGVCYGFLPPIDGIWDFSVRVNENLSDMTEEGFLETYTFYGLYEGAYLWKSESDLLSPAKNYTDEKTGECVVKSPIVVQASHSWEEVPLEGLDSDKLRFVHLVGESRFDFSPAYFGVIDAEENMAICDFDLLQLYEGSKVVFDVLSKTAYRIGSDGKVYDFIATYEDGFFDILGRMTSCVAGAPEGFDYTVEFLLNGTTTEYADEKASLATKESKAYTDERVGKPTAVGESPIEGVNGFSKIILPWVDGGNSFCIGNNEQWQYYAEKGKTLIFDIENKDSNLIIVVDDASGEKVTIEDNVGVLANMGNANYLHFDQACAFYYYTDCGTAIDDAKIHADNVSANAAANAKAYTDSAKDELKTYTDEKLMVTMKFNAKQGEEIIKLPKGYRGISKIKLWFEKADGSEVTENDMMAVSIHFYKGTTHKGDDSLEYDGDGYLVIDAGTGVNTFYKGSPGSVAMEFNTDKDVLRIMQNAECDGIKVRQYPFDDSEIAPNYVVKAELTMIAPLNEKVDAVLNESKSYADEKIQKAVVDSWEVAV